MELLLSDNPFSFSRNHLYNSNRNIHDNYKESNNININININENTFSS